jgi:hypothetical protein
MSTPPPSVRKELADYFHYCERLLASAAAPDHVPFSHDELKKLCYCANEVGKLVSRQGVTLSE